MQKEKGMLKELIESGEYPGWKEALVKESRRDYFRRLDLYVTEEYRAGTCFPVKQNIFAAFRYPRSRVKVVILGQDPYHEAGQAMGLAFSVPAGCDVPPSLQNIYKELREDKGVFTDGLPVSGDLCPWAEQGILLMNTLLTVREHQAFSHADRGWEEFSHNMLEYLLREQEGIVVGVLWGSAARKNKPLFSHECGMGHERFVIESAHPSPLSAYRGFFGSKPFSSVDNLLTKYGKEPIMWEAVKK